MEAAGRSRGSVGGHHIWTLHIDGWHSVLHGGVGLATHILDHEVFWNLLMFWMAFLATFSAMAMTNLWGSWIVLLLPSFLHKGAFQSQAIPVHLCFELEGGMGG